MLRRPKLSGYFFGVSLGSDSCSPSWRWSLLSQRWRINWWGRSMLLFQICEICMTSNFYPLQQWECYVNMIFLQIMNGSSLWVSWTVIVKLFLFYTISLIHPFMKKLWMVRHYNCWLTKGSVYLINYEWFVIVHVGIRVFCDGPIDWVLFFFSIE